MVEVILYNGNKPKKNGFRYSGFMLPIDWSGYYLDDLFDIRGGKPISRNNMANEGIACVHYGDIHTSNDLSLDVSSKYDQMPKVTKSQYIEKDLLFDGDIIFADASEDYAGIAKSIVVDNKESKHIISGLHTIVATPKNTLVYKSYSKYMFSSWFVRKQIMFFAQGISVFGISKNDLSSVIVLLPPLPEQKKIAEILSTWDEAIETNRKLLKSIEEYRAMQLRSYFIKMESTIVPISLEKLEDNGSIKLGRGRVISKDEMKSSKGLFPVYSSSIKNNGLMGYIDEYLFEEEMITWSIDGGGNFFYRDKHKFSVTNVSGFMRIIDDNIRPYFLASQLQYLHSKLVFDYQTKAHPSVIKTLYKVQIPTLNEQTRFEFLFKSIDKQIEKINQYINELQKQKQGLMQRLLTGKVRVKLD
jgi:type I restriction enzyme S subunit